VKVVRDSRFPAKEELEMPRLLGLFYSSKSGGVQKKKKVPSSLGMSERAGR